MIDLVFSCDAFHKDLVEVKYLILQVLPRAQLVLRQLKVCPVKGLLLLSFCIFLLQFWFVVIALMRLKYNLFHRWNELPQFLRGNRPQIICPEFSMAILWLWFVLIEAILMKEGFPGGALVLEDHFGRLLEPYFWLLAISSLANYFCDLRNVDTILYLFFRTQKVAWALIIVFKF